MPSPAKVLTQIEMELPKKLCNIPSAPFEVHSAHRQAECLSVSCGLANKSGLPETGATFEQEDALTRTANKEVRHRGPFLLVAVGKVWLKRGGLRPTDCGRLD